VPCVLIRAGGVLPGVIAVVTVVVMGKNGCCERMVVLNVCRFVLGTTSKIHVTGPEVVGSPSRSIVSVPFHVPAKNEAGAEGDAGLTPSPQPVVAVRRPARSAALQKCLAMRRLL
jgi:hypothetical protein